jgi:hypothetical protein
MSDRRPGHLRRRGARCASLVPWERTFAPVMPPVVVTPITVVIMARERWRLPSAVPSSEHPIPRHVPVPRHAEEADAPDADGRTNRVGTDCGHCVA